MSKYDSHGDPSWFIPAMICISLAGLVIAVITYFLEYSV